MYINSLQDLYIASLKQMHDGELQILDVVPGMIDATGDPDLERFLIAHQDATARHHKRLGILLDGLGGRRPSGRCGGIAALVDEGNAALRCDAAPHIKDVALIAIARQIKHFEIASYDTLRIYAELLGRDEDRVTLEKTLGEERAADERLHAIAQQTGRTEVPLLSSKS